MPSSTDFISDVNRFDAVLRGLLECYSPSHEERSAAEYLTAQMTRLGYDRAFVDAAGNAVGILGDGPQTIVLLGHIDTVPGFIDVTVQDGLLYGRGAVDAKGPLATFTLATALAGRRTEWRFVVIGAVEEEAATSKGARYAVTEYQPHMCIIGEPSQWDRVTLGYKGRLLLDYRFTRSITHTSRPEASAAEQAVNFWNAVSAIVNEINTGHDKIFDQVQSSLRSIQSSEDGFYETATMTIGFRLPVEAPPELLKPLLLAHADGAEIVFRGEEVCYRGDRTTPLVRAFNNAIRDQGGKPGYLYKTGTSDMNVVGPIWKCPILAYGPGDSALDHTPHEHINLDEYHKGIAVLADVLRNL